MVDLKVALQEIKEESASGILRPAAGPALPQTKPRAHPRSIWLATSLALIVVAALAAWLLRPAPAALPEPELTATALTTDPGIEDFPTFSPNGSQVAYMWNGPNQDNFDIYVRVVGAGAPLRLTSDPAVDSSPAWSPDGRTIAFLRNLAGGRFAVMLVAPIGGPERKVAEVSSRFAALGPVSWAPDGRTLAVPNQDATRNADGIFLISTRDRQQTADHHSRAAFGARLLSGALTRRTPPRLRANETDGRRPARRADVGHAHG